MNYTINRQESYSRAQLLLRTLLGWAYILIPHYFVVLVYSIGAMFYGVYTFFSILFTRSFPKSAHDFFVDYTNYGMRVVATYYNLREEYPSFSLSERSEEVYFDMPYKPIVKRRTLLIRMIFGVIMLIPHLVVIYFRLIGVIIVNFIAFWAILFTKKYPEGMFNFVVESFRYFQRVGNWTRFFTTDYPPFHGRIIENENADRLD
ncbi:MAG: DUF4389 domain-containing protein [Flavobacteriales bacterium]